MFSSDILSYIAISPGHGQGNRNLSPYLVSVEEIEPWGGACVPKRTFPSNNGIRGDSVRGEREPKEFRPHPIGVRGGRGAPSLGSRVSQAGRLFERPVYRGRQSPHWGFQDWRIED